MSKMATWGDIKSYSGIGSGGSQCPTESSILNASLDLEVAYGYDSDQLVACEDISYYVLSVTTAPVQGGYGSYKITKYTLPSGGSGTPTQTDVTSSFFCDSTDTSICTIPEPGKLYGVKQGSCSIYRRANQSKLVPVTVGAPTTYTYRINLTTVPDTATVTFTQPSGTAGWQLLNGGRSVEFTSVSTSVTVSYSVSKTDYTTKTGTVTVTSSNRTVDKTVELEYAPPVSYSGSGPWYFINNTDKTVYYRWKYKTSSSTDFQYNPPTGASSLAAGSTTPTPFGSSTFVHCSVEWGYSSSSLTNKLPIKG